MHLIGINQLEFREQYKGSYDAVNNNCQLTIPILTDLLPFEDVSSQSHSLAPIMPSLKFLRRCYRTRKNLGRYHDDSRYLEWRGNGAQYASLVLNSPCHVILLWLPRHQSTATMIHGQYSTLPWICAHNRAPCTPQKRQLFWFLLSTLPLNSALDVSNGQNNCHRIKLVYL